MTIDPQNSSQITRIPHQFERIEPSATGLDTYLYTGGLTSHTVFVRLNKLIKQFPELKIYFVLDPDDSDGKQGGNYNELSNSITIRTKDLSYESLIQTLPSIKHESGHLLREHRIKTGTSDPYYGSGRSDIGRLSQRLDPKNKENFIRALEGFGITGQTAIEIFEKLTEQKSFGSILETISKNYSKEYGVDEQKEYLTTANSWKQIAETIRDDNIRTIALKKAMAYSAVSLLFAYRNKKLADISKTFFRRSQSSNKDEAINFHKVQKIRGVFVNCLNFRLYDIGFTIPLVKFNKTEPADINSAEFFAEAAEQLASLGFAVAEDAEAAAKIFREAKETLSINSSADK